MTKRIESALRTELAGWGLDLSDYQVRIESVYDTEPTLVREAIFYRPADGLSVQVSGIFTNRQGWPVQHDQPVLTGWHPTIIDQWERERTQP